jgi:hypothetical protein
MANDRLRAAMAAARLDIETVAAHVGVDPKTVQRWLMGRMPHARHRWILVDLLGEQEELLWPDRGSATGGAPHTAEIVAAWAHRADAPLALWSRLLQRASSQIDLLGYAILFLPEQHPDLPDLLAERCAAGLKVRVALADPTSAEVARRDELERLGSTLPARIRTTVQLLAEVRDVAGVELRYHSIPLYNAIYRFDEQMLVTPYLVGAHGFQHPLLHLRRRSATGIFQAFADQFEAIWAGTAPCLD